MSHPGRTVRLRTYLCISICQYRHPLVPDVVDAYISISFAVKRTNKMRKSRIRQNQPRTPHPNAQSSPPVSIHMPYYAWNKRNLTKHRISFNLFGALFNMIPIFVRVLIDFSLLFRVAAVLFDCSRWWNCSLSINMANAMHKTHYIDRFHDITLTIEFISMQNRKRRKKEGENKKKICKQSTAIAYAIELWPFSSHCFRENEWFSLDASVCVVIARNATEWNRTV